MSLQGNGPASLVSHDKMTCFNLAFLWQNIVSATFKHGISGRNGNGTELQGVCRTIYLLKQMMFRIYLFVQSNFDKREKT
jgi:hypothetical protein